MQIDQVLSPLRANPAMMPPIVLGVGLVSLDVIETAETTLYKAGGTCGNVLTILAYLGWSSFPINRIDGDLAGDMVRADMAKFNVRLDYLSIGPTAETPVIRHIVGPNVNGKSHRFSLRCPTCRSWLPTYRPVVTRALKAAPEITDLAANAQVFFMDRVSPSAIVLAMAAREAGALIVFEPSAVMTDSEFRAALSLAHVVKYSRENANKWPALSNCRAPLEVVTRGSEGLRYRRMYSSGRRTRWKDISAWRVARTVDSAGAGDWCTAVLVHYLATSSPTSIVDRTDAEFDTALTAAQAAAAWNCTFVGARGGMYNATRTVLDSSIKAALTATCASEAASENIARSQSVHHFCQRCACRLPEPGHPKST